MIQSRWRQLPLLLLFWLLAGCGGLPHTQSDMERAKTALESALQSWKKGVSAAKMKTLAEPLDFSDDDQRNGFRLLDFQIEGTGFTDREDIRFTTKLSLQDRRGKKVERTATYLIAPKKTPIAIARDPYF